MRNETKVVGKISFDDKILKVYESLDEPLFRVSDIADILGYSDGNTWNLSTLCEADEKLQLQIVVAGQRRWVSFVTETGLYNILAQSRQSVARKWRRVVFDELVRLRKSRNMDILEKFKEWDHMLDDIYFDPETGIMMRSVTVPGGDVIQVPFDGNF